MPVRSASIDLASAEDTGRAAAALGAMLVPGDILLLEGPVGAGKTHFARQLILPLLAQPEDIPSPTFTLVQSYDTTSGPLWHADLYRIGSVHEIEELGLTEAFEDAICLVEWPDRLGPLTPRAALCLSFSNGPTDESRHLEARWSDRRWDARMADWCGT